MLQKKKLKQMLTIVYDYGPKLYKINKSKEFVVAVSL